MAKSHGSLTVIIVNTKDLSQYCDTSELGTPADVHDVTGYGKTAHVYNGGLTDGKLTFGGKYDTQATTGPRAVLRPLKGQTVTWTRRPEGTGSGKPQDTGAGVLVNYVETNPVADMVSWSAEIQCSDTIDSTPQP